MSERLIKSKERVKAHGEVFTPSWLVEDMLDLVKAETDDIHKTFLFHFRPVNIYLVYGNINQNSQYITRRKVVEAMFFQAPCENVKPFIRNAKRFISIKKQPISID